HPEIARVHGEVIAGGAGTDHHHAATLHHQHGDRERRRPRMFEHEIDVVALASDLPDGGAEFARLLEPGIVFGAADLRQLAPAIELRAVDDAASAQLHDEVALVVVRHDADGVGARGCNELHRHRAQAAGSAPYQHVLAGSQHMWAVAE